HRPGPARFVPVRRQSAPAANGAARAEAAASRRPGQLRLLPLVPLAPFCAHGRRVRSPAAAPLLAAAKRRGSPQRYRHRNTTAHRNAAARLVNALALVLEACGADTPRK